jgi:AraC-like DNA-binding protein
VEDYPPHWHSDIEVIMPLKEGYTVKIDDKMIRMQEGEILFIPPGVIHEIYAPGSGERLITQISYSLISEMDGFYAAIDGLYPYIHVQPAINEEVHGQLAALLKEIEKENRQQESFYGAMVHSLMRRFLVLLARNGREFGSQDQYHRYAKSVDGFLRVCDYIHHHCAEPLSVSLLSEVAGYSKSHFLRMFKEFSNISCGEYIQQQRIKKAMHLLVTTSMTLAQICYECGFSSQSYFNFVFKRNTGCTPRTYAKQVAESYHND